MTDEIRVGVLLIMDQQGAVSTTRLTLVVGFL